MPKQSLKTWFNFSRQERRALMVVWIIIVIIALLPYVVSHFKKDIPTDFSVIHRLSAQLQDNTRRVADTNYATAYHNKIIADDLQLFYFDPNTINEAGWKKLGVPGKIIQTIEHYKNKGGRFYKKEDLQKIYGFRSTDYARLEAYIQIKNLRDSVFKKQDKQFTVAKSFVNNYAKAKNLLIEINSADTTQFIQLRGIGSKLANRIVSFRSSLGGFYSINQLGEVYALPDSTFQQIKPFLLIDTSKIVKININTADVKTLQQHPYIRYALANTIINYRKQHGAFKAIEDLKNIILINDQVYQKIAPYLTVN